MRISPSSIASRPARQLRSVVLPQPLGPMIATISPRPSVEVDPTQSVNFHLAGVVRLLNPSGLDDRGSPRSLHGYRSRFDLNRHCEPFLVRSPHSQGEWVFTSGSPVSHGSENYGSKARRPDHPRVP